MSDFRNGSNSPALGFERGSVSFSRIGSMPTLILNIADIELEPGLAVITPTGLAAENSTRG